MTTSPGIGVGLARKAHAAGVAVVGLPILTAGAFAQTKPHPSLIDPAATKCNTCHAPAVIRPTNRTLAILRGFALASTITCVIVPTIAAQSVGEAAARRRAIDSAAKSNAGVGEVTGKILETMDAAGYTYVRLETASGEVWAAITQTPLKAGEVITIHREMTAEKFESKALNRTFDRLAFGAILTGTPASDAKESSAAAHMTAADAGTIDVAKTEGGHAVSELWASKATLRDTEVLVRGKVVKSVLHVMNRNWVHLRDGSGSRETGTDDITLTTEDEVAVGDVATFRGTLRVERDFGAGYRYALIIEDARIVLTEAAALHQVEDYVAPSSGGVPPNERRDTRGTPSGS